MHTVARACAQPGHPARARGAAARGRTAPAAGLPGSPVSLDGATLGWAAAPTGARGAPAFGGPVDGRAGAISVGRALRRHGDRGLRSLRTRQRRCGRGSRSSCGRGRGSSQTRPARRALRHGHGFWGGGRRGNLRHRRDGSRGAGGGRGPDRSHGLGHNRTSRRSRRSSRLAPAHPQPTLALGAAAVNRAEILVTRGAIHLAAYPRPRYCGLFSDLDGTLDSRTASPTHLSRSAG